MRTYTRCAALLVAILAIAGCRDFEGDYAPGCQAYAGSRIQLADGNYVWERFTDARRVDAEGNVIDPYPGYPKRGRYERSGPAFRLLDADGETLATYHLHESDSGLLLLTAEQQAAWEADGSYPDCPLTRQTSR